VELILNVEIMLRFSKVRQDLSIRPFIIAESSPGVKILGESPLHRLTVDGRPSPDHLALRHVDLPLLLSDGSPQGPVVFRVWGFCKSGVAELYFVRKIGWIRVIRPSFQQQNGGIRVFSQSAGQHRASCSRADDHHVIFHGPSLNPLSSTLGFLRVT
jgi:hypothetical protein